MRLTDNEFHSKENKERACYIQEPRIQAIYDKLFDLEDIEEELGIDLITLFKAEKDGIWYNSNGTFYFNYFDVSLAHRCFRRYVDYFRNYMSFDFKDYGKTWALTKEELL